MRPGLTFPIPLPHCSQRQPLPAWRLSARLVRGHAALWCGAQTSPAVAIPGAPQAAPSAARAGASTTGAASGAAGGGPKAGEGAAAVVVLPSGVAVGQQLVGSWAAPPASALGGGFRLGVEHVSVATLMALQVRRRRVLSGMGHVTGCA